MRPGIGAGQRKYPRQRKIRRRAGRWLRCGSRTASTLAKIYHSIQILSRKRIGISKLHQKLRPFFCVDCEMRKLEALSKEKNRLPWKLTGILQKCVEKAGEIRYNYRVINILSDRAGSPDRRNEVFIYGKKSRNRIQRHPRPHHSGRRRSGEDRGRQRSGGREQRGL